jgi:hypothetical protein
MKLAVPPVANRTVSETPTCRLPLVQKGGATPSMLGNGHAKVPQLLRLRRLTVSGAQTEGLSCVEGIQHIYTSAPEWTPTFRLPLVQ